MSARYFTARPPQRGAALVITMFFIVIITIMVIGFLDSSRIERSVAQTHFEKMRATTIASQGIEAVVATLRRETADPPRQTGETDDNYDKRRRNWTSQPGQLSVPDDPKTGSTIDQKRLVKTARLYSGTPTTPPPSAPGVPNASSVDPVFLPPNLNVETLSDQNPATYLIADPPANKSPIEMKLRWIYQREKADASNTYFVLDGDGQPTEKPVLDPKNPIVGRFAYWADDESSKVNYNLAWSRESKTTDQNYNKNPPGHQTQVDLRALSKFTPEVTLNLHTAVTADKYYATINRFFNSPFDARQIDDPAIRAALDENKFNLTHYNSDPDTTYYGRSRMMLTTQLSNAVLRDAKGNILYDKSNKPLTRPYLDILWTDNTDPGATASVNGVKLGAMIGTLVEKYLKRKDWPMVDGLDHSVQEKYYANYSDTPPVPTQRDLRLAQLALNIIDYVRSAESSRQVVEPIRGLYKGTTFTPDFVDGTLRGKEDTFKGLTRGPYITEMGVWVADKAETTGNNKGRSRMLAFVEVYLPKNYGIDALDLLSASPQWYLYFKAAQGGYLRDGKTTSGPEYTISYRATRDLPDNTPITGSQAVSPVFVWDAIGDKAKAVMKPGEYRTLAFEVWRTAPKAQTGPLLLRSAITLGTNARQDVAPLGDPASTTTVSPKPLVYTVSLEPSTIDNAFDSISSVETSDPRVNGVAADWKPHSKNTFSQENQEWKLAVGQNPQSLLPEQDLDMDGKVSAASLRMPYPAGHPSNPNGRVRSPGELGLIHTGIEGSSLAPRGGIPWRTLHLQPSKQATTVVPDWAFMDLFTVPADVPQKATVLFAPRGNSTGGRVNMNAQPVPFDLRRTDPLAAVLYGCRWTNNAFESKPTLDLTQAQEIAGHIYNRDRASGSKVLPVGKRYPMAAGTQPDVYESPGEVVEIQGVADKGEESEELVREIANLITARGNVFSVYTIGQALKQTPSGKLLVTGEQRQQAYLERYLVDRGNDDPNDDTIGFRTIYFRNLVP